MLAFVWGCFSGRDDSDHLVILAICMAYDQQSQRGAESEEKESILLPRMVRIVFQSCPLVGEDRDGFLKRDAVLAAILFRFGIVPANRNGVEFIWSI